VVSLTALRARLPYSSASFVSYLAKNASNCSAPTVPSANSSSRAASCSIRIAASGCGAGPATTRACRRIVDAVIGAAVDHVAGGRRRRLALEADERDVARRVRELVRADRRERDDVAARPHAALPCVAPAVLPAQVASGVHAAGELQQEARGRGVRILEDVVRVGGERRDADRLAVDVDEPRARIQSGRGVGPRAGARQRRRAR
jgi:hypothetical protein